MSSSLNRSLERGVDILRAFRPGSTLLGNGELAERTGLSPATVSRLTQTLVSAGMLEHDRPARAYRLAAPVLSLAHAMRTGSAVLQVAAPLMRSLAERLRVNVGLAVADHGEMVYLESIRYSRRASLRNVVSGQRVPIELTSLGRAWLASAPEESRRVLYDEFAIRRKDWLQLRRQVDKAIDSVRRQGWCAASWQAEVIAVATPLCLQGTFGHVLNVSVSSSEPIARVSAELSAPLMVLATQVAAEFDLAAHGTAQLRGG